MTVVLEFTSELRAQTDKSIFISYSRANTDFARELYTKLHALGFKLWRDRTEMEAGENWWQQIQDAIRNSATMVLACHQRHWPRQLWQMNGVMLGVKVRG